jgi:hypothetical protein
MGKDLHYLVIKFFKERMSEHSQVRGFTEIQDDNEILYRIERVGDLPSLTVHLSDAYRYTMHDYYCKPAVLQSGDFILIARPEADFGEEIVVTAARDGIGIGNIAKFMGALHHRDVWLH